MRTIFGLFCGLAILTGSSQAQRIDFDVEPMEGYIVCGGFGLALSTIIDQEIESEGLSEIRFDFGRLGDNTYNVMRMHIGETTACEVSYEEVVSRMTEVADLRMSQIDEAAAGGASRQHARTTLATTIISWCIGRYFENDQFANYMTRHALDGLPCGWRE